MDRFEGHAYSLYTLQDVADFIASGGYIGKYFFQYKVLIPAFAVSGAFGYFEASPHLGQTFHMFCSGYAFAKRSHLLALLGPIVAGHDHVWAEDREQADMFRSDSAWALGYLWGRYR